MKLKRLNAALALAAIVTFAAPAPVSAQVLGQDPLKDLTSLKITNTDYTNLFIKAKPKKEATPPVQAPQATPAPQPVQHKVVDGDNLSKVAAAHGTTWKRLWDKNLALTSPDVIRVADVLTVPLPDEQVPERALPAPIVVTPATATTPASAPAAAAVVRGPGGPNTYTAGYCTWYVKNRRADLPSSLGNANTWYSRAAAAGMAVGTQPRAGAVGTTERGALGHVVYVESVNGDGSITISEMNYSGRYSQRTRAASASEFRYIY